MGSVACLLFEDDHLLVVNKPAGLSTHSPSRYAGEGLYEWLKNREPRWANLAIIHRLDKETSGVIVFSKTPLANRSLTQQFAGRQVRKKYLFQTDRTAAEPAFTAKSCLVRAGERYISRPLHRGGEVAETRFLEVQSPKSKARSSTPTGARVQLWEAAPITGKTHQIRVHAAEKGVPILGDVLYDGTLAARVYLHALELEFEHPETGKMFQFRAEPDFESEPRAALRAALTTPDETNAFRLIHGASDGWPGWYVDRVGRFLLSQAEDKLAGVQSGRLQALAEQTGAEAAYHKLLSRQVRKASPDDVAPRHVFGVVASDRFEIRENGVRFEMSFSEGYSTGLFLDQRENRRRLLSGYVAPDFFLWHLREDRSRRGKEAKGPENLQEGPPPYAGGCQVLNVFAYTCGFSVCAAKAGARVASLDLSKKYLEWGKSNFALNGMDTSNHDFIFGDAFDWLERFAKKGRRFQVVLLDPPTFSRSKEFGMFRAEKDYGQLVTSALRALDRNGVLFCSTNAAEWRPDEFLKVIDQAISKTKRQIVQRHYVPQPPDFPISREEPGYLKTAWLRIE